MANILVISPIPTLPIDSGNRARLNLLLSELKSAGHRIHFLYLERFQTADIEQMKRLYDSFHVLTYRKKGILPALSMNVYKVLRKNPGIMGLLDRYIATSRPFKRKKPFKIDDWYDSRIDEKVQEIKRSYPIDTVIVEYVYLSKVLENFDSTVLKIIDTHDVFANRERLYENVGLNPVAFFTTKDEEKKGLSRADLILAIQTEDAEYFSDITDKRVITLGYRLNISGSYRVLTRPSTKFASYILYVGSNTVANQHAMDFFIDNVWPKLKNEVPEIKLLIIGNICHYIKRRPKHDGIVLKYRVSNLGDFYQKDCIVINPIFIGTGLKIKNMEALYWARPLITTKIGAQGLRRWKDKAFLVANNAKDMQSAIKTLYKRPDLRMKYSEQAMHFVEEYNLEYDKALKTFLSQLT